MAKFFAVSVRDGAAQTFGTPFCVPRIEVAERQFFNEVNRVAENNPMFTNAADFDLFLIGSYDDELGLMSPELVEGSPRPRLVVRGADAKRVVN